MYKEQGIIKITKSKEGRKRGSTGQKIQIKYQQDGFKPNNNNSLNVNNTSTPTAREILLKRETQLCTCQKKLYI